MSCDVGKVTEGLENELSSFYRTPVSGLGRLTSIHGSPGDVNEEPVT